MQHAVPQISSQHAVAEFDLAAGEVAGVETQPMDQEELTRLGLIQCQGCGAPFQPWALIDYRCTSCGPAAGDSVVNASAPSPMAASASSMGAGTLPMPGNGAVPSSEGSQQRLGHDGYTNSWATTARADPWDGRDPWQRDG